MTIDLAYRGSSGDSFCVVFWIPRDFQLQDNTLHLSSSRL